MAQIIAAIPAFTSAMQDRQLRGNAREVYLWLHEHLDLIEYRQVKHSVVGAALGMNDRSVCAAMNRLVDRAYLDRGPRDGRIITYRLYYSRPLD